MAALMRGLEAEGASRHVNLSQRCRPLTGHIPLSNICLSGMFRASPSAPLISA